MRRLKREALENCELTDFSFLVGPEEEDAQLLHCFKLDLQLASEYFRALLRSPLTGPPPVRIRHIQPHIFKIIIKYISLQTLEEAGSLEDALALALAADEFLLDTLKPFYQSEVERLADVDNVWALLEHNIPFTEAACIKVLSTKTKECIEHQTFLEASHESVIFLLKLEELNIRSEADLVEACFKWIKDKPEDVGSELMKEALPHLRLLNLSKDEIKPELLEYLSDSEQLFLFRNQYGKTEGAEVPGCLNATTSARKAPPNTFLKGKQILQIIPDSAFVTEPSKRCAANLTTCSWSQLTCNARHDLLLHGVDIMTPAKKDLKYVLQDNGNGTKRFKTNESEPITYTVEVLYSAGKRVLHSQEVTSNEPYFSWFHLDLTEKVCIPRNTQFAVKVSHDSRHKYVDCIRHDSNVRYKKDGDITKWELTGHNRSNYHSLFPFMIKNLHYENVNG